MKKTNKYRKRNITYFLLFLLIFFSSVTQSADSATFSESARSSVIIGAPPSNCPQGWATTGYISQGPEGGTSHGDPPVAIGTGSLEAVDIATPIGTKVYATVNGIVKESFVNRGNALDQRIAVQPTNCPGLDMVYYWHLSSRTVNVDDPVVFGRELGLSGLNGTGAHMHYQFNNSPNRGYSISDPLHVPTAVWRPCNDIGPCATTITSAPL